MRLFAKRIARTAASLLPAALAASPAAAAEFDVPSVFPTLQAAVAAVEAEAADAKVEHYVNLTSPVVTTTAEVLLDESFEFQRRVTFRPDPETLDRATILSTNGSQPIFRLADASYVTIQDLDIVRNTTNAASLIVMVYGGFAGNIENVIERCRIGSTWTVPGAPGFAYVRIQKPTGVILRNCIFFSLAPGTFDVGIWAHAFGDPANSLHLYNNVVADHRVFGIFVEDGHDGSTLVLRNNVVVNHPDAPVEPFAYRSDVSAGVVVVTSHNTAFASGGLEEQVLDALPISFGTTADFLQFDRDDGVLAFAQTAWTLDPEFDDPEDNDNLFELLPLGVLHTGPEVWGQTVLDGDPHAVDVAVLDDWEGDLRPSGAEAHTDRGADQVETALASAAAALPEASSWAVAESNPAPAVGVLFRAPAAGTLAFEVFDVAGRRAHRTERAVANGESGRLAWKPGRGAAGVYWWRVRLAAAGPAAPAPVGRVVVRE
jgi:hypothetical protein